MFDEINISIDEIIMLNETWMFDEINTFIDEKNMLK